MCVWRGNSLTFVILSKWMDGSFQFSIWKKAIIIHHWSFLIHHSSFVVHGMLNHSSFIIHHSSFFIHHSSFIIHHHSSFSIDHCSFGRHSEIDEQSMRNLSKLNQKWTKNQCKIYQKSINNEQKINPKSTKLGLGAPLEPSWRRPSRHGGGTDVLCLFRCNNVEFSVQMGNGSVCRDVERFSFVCFDVTTSSSSVAIHHS